MNKILRVEVEDIEMMLLALGIKPTKNIINSYIKANILEDSDSQCLKN